MQAFGDITHKQPLIFKLEMVQRIFIYCFHVILLYTEPSVFNKLSEAGIREYITLTYVHSKHCNKIRLLERHL